MVNNSDDVIYYSCRYWTYYDNDVSSNEISLELFNNTTNGFLSSPRIKLTIRNRNGYSNVLFGSSELFRFSQMCKSYIVDKWNKHKEEFGENRSYTDGFFVNVKKNVYVTYMQCPTTSSACIRIMIGEREQSILDSEKVYIQLPEFISFYQIINQIFNNYISICNNSYIFNEFREIKENQKMLQTKIDSLMFLNNKKESESIQIETKKESELQNEFSNFIKEKRDTFDLDIDLESDNNIQKKTETAIKYTSDFADKVLNKDFLNLEKLIINCINSDLPFDSFRNCVLSTCGIDLYNGFSNKDINALNYLICRNLKYNVNNYIQNKVKLPGSTIPILVDNNSTDLKINDVMYQLLISYIYISKVKIQLNEKINNNADNKDLFSYSLKTITSPIVFSFVLKIKKEIFLENISRIYRYNRENNFYSNFETQIKKLTGVDISMNNEHLMTQVDRIYTTASQLKDKLSIGKFFNLPFLSLKYDDFLNHTELNLDDVFKICQLDWCFYNFKTIDTSKLKIKSYDTIPMDILSKYNLTSKKYDNSIIVRYFKDNFSSLNNMEQINKINVNVYDILDEIDIIDYPQNALRALYFWNIDTLPKNLNYNQFVKMIEDSNLTSNMLISMILNKNNVTDPSFYNSYLVASE